MIELNPQPAAGQRRRPLREHCGVSRQVDGQPIDRGTRSTDQTQRFCRHDH